MAVVYIQMVELIDTIMSIPSCLQDQQSKIQVSPSLLDFRTKSLKYRSVNTVLPSGPAVQDTGQSIFHSCRTNSLRYRSDHPSCIQASSPRYRSVHPFLTAGPIVSDKSQLTPSCLQDQQTKIQVSPSLPASRNCSLRFKLDNSFLPPGPTVQDRYRSVHPFLHAGSTVQDTGQSIPSCLQYQ
jgi:hypothetical protein